MCNLISDTDVKIQKNILTNKIEQGVEEIIYLEQVEFIPETRVRFNIRKLYSYTILPESRGNLPAHQRGCRNVI